MTVPLVNQFRDEVFETARKLAVLPHLEPLPVATQLSRRMELESEDEYQTSYTLIGGPPLPFCRIWIRWLKKRVGGILQLEPAQPVRIPLTEVAPFFGPLPRPGFGYPPHIGQLPVHIC